VSPAGHRHGDALDRPHHSRHHKLQSDRRRADNAESGDEQKQELAVTDGLCRTSGRGVTIVLGRLYQLRHILSEVQDKRAIRLQ
jgi:hypothetical protein